MADRSVGRVLDNQPWAITVLLVFLFAAAFYEVSNARDSEIQVSNSRYLGLVLGTGISSYREDLLVPLGFDGPGFALGTGYSRKYKDSDFDFRVKLGAALLKNRFSHTAYAANLEIHPAWSKRVYGMKSHGTIHAGLCLPIKMNNIFLESWDEAHLYWLTSYSLGPIGKWKKRISSAREIEVGIELPVISLVSRPPRYRYRKQEALNHLSYHFSEPNKFLKLELPDVYRAILIRFNLVRITDRALFNMGLEFEYKYCKIPEKIYALNTIMMLSYQWRTRL